MSSLVDAVVFVLVLVWLNWTAGMAFYAILGIYVTAVDENAVEGMAGRSRRALVIRAVADCEIIHETVMLALNLFILNALVRHPSFTSLLLAVVTLPRLWLLGEAVLRRRKLDRLPIGARFFPKVSLESTTEPQVVVAQTEQQRAAFEALKRPGYRRLVFFGVGAMGVAATVFFLGVNLLRR